MIDVRIRDDFKHIQRELRGQRQKVPKIMAQALTATVKNVETAAVKEIARESGLKQKEVRQAMELRKASWGSLTAWVQAKGRHFNLIRFKARENKKGVAASPWRKRRTFKGAFIGNQGRTVFIRQSKNRLDIRPMYGPSIPREMVRDVVKRKTDETINKRWPENLRQAWNRFTR